MATTTKAVIVFLLGLFVISASFVIIWGVSIYKETTKFANKTSAEEIGCVGYVYDVSGMQYYDSTLFLDITNRPYSDKRISSISVRVGNYTVADDTDLDQAMSQTLTFRNIFIDDEFFVYPDACKDFTIKCSLFTQNCGVVNLFP